MTPRFIITKIGFALHLANACLAVAEPNPQITPIRREITSPDQQSAVKIEHRALPRSDSVDGFFTLVLRVHGIAVLECPTMGYLLDAFWSPDNRYVAVNNRRSNSGDYVWVFSVPDRRVLEVPNDKVGEMFAHRAAARFSELTNASFEKFTNLAKKWINSRELEVESRIVFRHPSSVVMRRAVYEIDRGKLNLKTEEFTRVSRS